MADLLPKDAISSAWDAVCSAPIVAEALAALPQLPLGFPTKFLAVAGAAALGYYVDQKLLISSDLYHSGMQAVALLQAKRHAHNGTLIPDLFEQSVAKWPHKPCIQYGPRVLSFLQVDDAANRVAHWGLRQGLQPGQTVALLMENRPEFVVVWLGLAKIGVVTALLNTHLQPDGLVHCAKIADTRWMIVGEELADKLAQVDSQLADIDFHIYGDGEDRPLLATTIQCCGQVF
jgi:solute carrier family 27 fatty acid transporter 1/4